MVNVAKFHGTGNDFVVVDAAEDVPDRRAFAERLCDRDDGIDHPDARERGADGVLFLALEEQYTPPRVVMTLVQPDGSTAAMCGNGARCAAVYTAHQTGADDVMIDTQSGTRRATVHDCRALADGDDGPRTCDVSIEMGEPSFAPADVPVDADEPVLETDIEGLTVTAVNTGVPHAVAFVDDVDEVALSEVAPAVRHADVFPEGANVNVASGRDDGGYDQRTFERGVEGETDSCGTGAVAIAAVAHRLGHVGTGDSVTVSPPGGDLDVTVGTDGATLRGPVVREFRESVAAAPPR